MVYLYRIRLGLATLIKMEDSGTDIDQKPKKIGQYKTELEARNACANHYEKACKMATAAGRDKPKILFV